MDEQNGARVGGALDRFREQYRKRPVAAWGATAAVVGVVVAIVVIVAVNETGDEQANVPLACSVSDSDGSTVVSIRGKVTRQEADEGCDAVAARLSGEGRYWRVGLSQTPDDYPDLVCALDAPDGQQGTVMVEADPEAFTSSATAMCGELAHEGWTQLTQGGVMGPWQRQHQSEQEAQEAAELVEQEIREEEELEWEEEEQAVFACEEQVEAREEAALEAIDAETQERMAEAGSESEEFRLEEEGWEEEERVWEQGEEEALRCEESGGAEAGAGGLPSE